MGTQVYFVNETKKQIVDSKMLTHTFEDEEQLLYWLRLSIGDRIKIHYETTKFIEELIYEGLHSEYDHVKLYEYKFPNDIEKFFNRVTKWKQ